MSVKWISHRGESIDAPENTLAAFSLAAARHTDGMECDLMLTADGVAAVSHDATTERMGDRCLSIADSTFAELARVNVSGAFIRQYPDEHIPSLSAALDRLAPGQEFFLELKPGCPALVSAVKKVVSEKKLRPEQIVIITRDHELILRSKQEMPQYRALWLPGPQRQYTPDELIAELTAMHADGVNASGANEYLLSAELIEKIHALGMLAGVAVVEHPEQARRIIGMGIDYITSSRAAALRDMLEPK